MDKVKIALLDTGISRTHNYLKKSVYNGLTFINQNGHYLPIKDNYDDDNGHGTACASVIKKECQNVDFFAIKILDNKMRTNLKVLEESLKYLLNTDIRLINLSLSVLNSSLINDLQILCEKLINRNKIIICSLANGYERSYPAIFNKVIGVKGFILENENSFWYNRNKNIQCVIDNNPYFYCDINNSYQMFGKCNSQAAAKLTGIVAGILYKEPDIKIEELNIKLEFLAGRNEWRDCDLIKSKRYPEFYCDINNKEIVDFVIEILKQVLGKNFKNNEFLNHSLFDKDIGLKYSDCFNVIKKLENIFQIDFDYMSISRYDFYSIYTLSNLVQKVYKKET